MNDSEWVPWNERTDRKVEKYFVKLIKRNKSRWFITYNIEKILSSKAPIILKALQDYANKNFLDKDVELIPHKNFSATERAGMIIHSPNVREKNIHFYDLNKYDSVEFIRTVLECVEEDAKRQWEEGIEEADPTNDAAPGTNSEPKEEPKTEPKEEPASIPNKKPGRKPFFYPSIVDVLPSLDSVENIKENPHWIPISEMKENHRKLNSQRNSSEENPHKANGGVYRRDSAGRICFKPDGFHYFFYWNRTIDAKKNKQVWRQIVPSDHSPK